MTDSALCVTRWPRIRNERLTPATGGRALRGLVALAFAAVLGACFGGGRVETAAPSESTSQRATRTSLTARLETIDRELASGAARGKNGTALSAEAATIRVRLKDGDFRPGDRFLVNISQSGVTRSDTASIRDSLMVTLVGLPDVSLQGTLRSELNEKLSEHVARFLKNAIVRTVVFTRISIMGAVGAPGFFVVAPDRPISELIMVAGGTTLDAKLNDMQVYRGRAVLMDKKETRLAFNEGKTLEQLDIRSGDEFRIPIKRRITFQSVIQILFIVSSLFFALVNFLRFYYSQQAT